MRTKVISLIMSCAVAAPVIAGFVQPVKAEGETSAVVSGYISVQNTNLTLAGQSKIPKIYVSSDEAESVIRAAVDLKTDIYKVTGITPGEAEIIGGDSQNAAMSLAGAEEIAVTAAVVEYAGSGMVITAENFFDEGTGIAAVYEDDGKLLKVITAQKSENGVFTFDDKAEKPDGGSFKFFIWSSPEEMKPLAVITEIKTAADPTEEPESTDIPDVTNAPTDMPVDAPTSAPASTPKATPTSAPTSEPTSVPTDAPTSAPTDAPTNAPTDAPTAVPTSAPTSAPTDAPTSAPTNAPTDTPVITPTNTPEETAAPTIIPIETDADIIIGTIGKSDAIAKLISEGLDVSDIEGKFEAFKIDVVDNKLVIAGSDDRGTIYGIYDVSEKIGVSPWYDWADVPIGHADDLYIDREALPYIEGEPSVKQRGIFINDELALQLYAKQTRNDSEWVETYQRIYELLLRLKANTLWPSMQKNLYGGSVRGVYFHKNPQNAANAEKYGISIGSSHCEILLRNNEMEFADYETAWKAANPSADLYSESPDGSAAATTYVWVDELNGTHYDNKVLLKDYWTDSVHKYGKPTDLYTVGLRNAHDETWDPQYCKKSGEAKSEIGDETKKMRSELILDAIKTQREILEKEFCTEDSGLTIEDIPQVFIPYKEIQIYYDYYCEHKNEFTYQLPDDISVMWTDDNYGYMRQLPTELDRDRKGGAGVYYHISYHGSPNSYLWLCTTPLSLIREELQKAYDNNAAGAWIINVGDIKPAETQIGYIMHMARDMENNTDITGFLKMQAKRDFGMNDEDAAEYAGIVKEYNTLTMARKPEYTYKDETGSASSDSMKQRHFTYGVYGDEGGAYTAKYDELVSRAETLNTKLDTLHKNPFYELLLYPLKGARNRAKWMTSGEKSTLYKDTRGALINKYANEHDAAYEEIVSETKYYNETLANGKWNRIMWPMQDHFGTTRNARLYADEVTTSRATDFSFAEMGVESDDMNFTNYSSRLRYIDIFNKGTGSFDYSVSTDKAWVTINKTSGTVYSDDRIWIAVDPEKLESGTNEATVTIKRMAGENPVDAKTVTVTAVNKDFGEIPQKTYVESDGYVSIEAEHFTNSVDYGNMEWKAENGYARSGDSMKLYPNIYQHITNATKDNSAYLEYNVYFENAGTYNFDLYRMPTLNERGSVNVRVGVGDGTPMELTGNKEYYVNNSVGNDPWGLGVLTNNETLSTNITVAQGLNTIRVYGVDTTFVFDKIVITTANEKPFTYFGAPESYNSTYNNAVTLPAPSVTTADGEADEYTLYLEYIGSDDNKILLVKKTDTDKIIKVSAIGYAADGSISDIKTTDVDLSEYEKNETITLNNAVPDKTVAAKFSVIAYESYDTPVPVMLPSNQTISGEVSAPAATLSFKTSLAQYYGKQAVVTVTKNGDSEPLYIAQEALAANVFSEIPFANTLPSNTSYVIKAAVSDGTIIEKTVSTNINVQPDVYKDTPEAEKEIYYQTFESDPSADSTVSLVSGAQYMADSKCIRLNPKTTSSSTKVTVNLPQAIERVQGRQIKITADVAYGYLRGRQTTFRVSGKTEGASSNSDLIKSVVYFADSKANITVNGAELVDVFPSTVIRCNSGETRTKYIRYTIIYDPETGYMTVNLKNTDSGAEVSYTATAQKYSEISMLECSTDYTTGDKYASLFTNAYVGTVSDDTYGMTIDVKDSKTQGTLNDVRIAVYDGAYGTEIEPETDGRFMLSEGTYKVTATNEEASQTDEFEVVPSMDSKVVTVNFGTHLTAAEREWDLADCEAVTATGVQTVSYKGLEIHLDSGDSIGAGGLTWSQPGVNNASANTRYIAYTPVADGTLKVTGKVNASGGRFGIGETAAVGCLKDDGSSTKNTSQTTVSKAVKADTTYYIETKDKGAALTKIVFTPDAQ